MTKQELMENFTLEQLAEMLVTAIQSKEDDEKLIEIITSAGKDLGKQLDEKQNEIDHLKSEVNKYCKALVEAKEEHDFKIHEYQKKIEELEQHHKFSMMQIDDVLVEFLGVTHEVMDKPSDFEKVLQEEIDKSKTASDFLPTEPIKVVDMLIDAQGEYERSEISKRLFGEEKGKYQIFDISELRQIAQHLLIYCDANDESK